MKHVMKNNLKRRPQKKICYVIMPFSKHAGISAAKWTEIYNHFFKPAIESAGFGYKCIRSEITTGSFTKEIVENLKNAYLVLADITAFNGNVMWELGVRHSLSTRTIIVTNKNVKSKKFISDLSIYGVVEYSTKGPKQIDFFKADIKKILKKIKEVPQKPDNPVFDFLKIEDLIMKKYEETQIRNKLTGLLSELIENIRVADMHIKGKGTISKDQVGYYRFTRNAIQELLITNYIYTEDINEILHALSNWIHFANKAMDTLTGTMKSSSNEQYRKIMANVAKKYCREVRSRCNTSIKIINTIRKQYGKIIFEFTPEVIITDKKLGKLLN